MLRSGRASEVPEIHPHKIKLRNKVWTLCTHKMAKNFGLCEPEPNAPNKHIWIDPSCKRKKMLEILLHEMIHCCQPDLDEEAVTGMARDQAKVLWDLGYRGEWDE
jgi:hypothetical protein